MVTQICQKTDLLVLVKKEAEKSSVKQKWSSKYLPWVIWIFTVKFIINSDRKYAKLYLISIEYLGYT